MDLQGRSRGDDRPPVVVRGLAPDEWMTLREVRLRALDDAPHAFLTGAAPESGWVEGRWRSTFETGAWAVAQVRDELVGLGRAAREPQAPRRRHLESVWVDPAHRRRGVASCLVTWLIEAELATGANDLRLWIFEGNEVARRFYESLGFRATGERQEVLGRSRRIEERLRLSLADAGAGH
jgi:ribosomal protein S18 acetylase RimI-like enzyme